MAYEDGPYDANEQPDEILTVLKSIDATLKAMLALARARAPKSVEVATDRDLDGQHGNPVVKLTPRDWTGASMKERRMSECPPDFLDLLAETFDYLAGKAEENNETYNGKLTAPYKRKDAARARGWAKRIREGKVRQAPTGPVAVGGPGWKGGF